MITDEQARVRGDGHLVTVTLDPPETGDACTTNMRRTPELRGY